MNRQIKDTHLKIDPKRLHGIIIESIRNVMDDESVKRPSISFERLKSVVKRQLLNAANIAMNHPGEYTADRMLQMLGKQERTGHVSVYEGQALIDKVHSMIDRFDIRQTDELLSMCKEYWITVPKWLYKGYVPELTEDGWMLFGK